MDIVHTAEKRNFLIIYNAFKKRPYQDIDFIKRFRNSQIQTMSCIDGYRSVAAAYLAAKIRR